MEDEWINSDLTTTIMNLIERRFFMEFGETEIIREEENIRLLKVGAKYDREVFWVLGNGSSKCFDDYEDALEEFNLRWMKIQFGD